MNQNVIISLPRLSTIDYKRRPDNQGVCEGNDIDQTDFQCKIFMFPDDQYFNATQQ